MEIPKAKIFLNPEVGRYFDEKLPFVAFGEDCEKVLEYMKEGKSIPIFSTPEEASKGATIGAFFVNGKIYKKGSVKEVYQAYSTFIHIQSEKKDYIKLNQAKIEELKKLDLGFKIRNIRVMDEEGNENYIFLKGKIIVDIELENFKGDLLALTVWRKETIFESSFKFLEFIAKPKEGKARFFIETESLPDGNWVLKFFYKQDGEVKEIPGEIEIGKRKI